MRYIVNFKQVIGALLLIGGIFLVGLANYINTQVAAGNDQIFSAQKKVDQGNSLFSNNPITNVIGQSLTSGAQKKINQGKADIQYYTVIAQRCQVGGIALAVIGAGMIYFCRNKKSKAAKRKK
jgi:hypothetical protein